MKPLELAWDCEFSSQSLHAGSTGLGGLCSMWCFFFFVSSRVFWDVASFLLWSFIFPLSASFPLETCFPILFVADVRCRWVFCLGLLYLFLYLELPVFGDYSSFWTSYAYLMSWVCLSFFEFVFVVYMCEWVYFSCGLTQVLAHVLVQVRSGYDTIWCLDVSSLKCVLFVCWFLFRFFDMLYV